MSIPLAIYRLLNIISSKADLDYCTLFVCFLPHIQEHQKVMIYSVVSLSWHALVLHVGYLVNSIKPLFYVKLAILAC